MAIEPSPASSSIPPRTALLTNLIQQTHLLTQLFTHLSSSNPPVQSTDPNAQPINPISGAYTSLLGVSDSLSDIVRDTWTHQAAVARLEQKKREVAELEDRVRELLKELEGSRRELEVLVEEGQEVRESIDRLTNDPVHVPTLLAHAKSLSRFSSAPVSSLLTPMDKAQYTPWPTETAMRQGILFMEGGGSMVPFGNIGKQGEETAVREEVRQVVPEEQPQRRREMQVFNLDLNSDSDDD